MPSTHRPAPEDTGYHGLHGSFLRGLRTAEHDRAVEAGGEHLSYGRLHETALRWAGALLHHLDERPTAVGVLGNKSPAAYTGVLAALYTGAAVVPLNPAFPAARNRYALDAAGVSAIVADEHGAGALPGLLRADDRIPVLKGHLDLLAPPGGGAAVRSATALAEPEPVSPSGDAYILFTSGSTGRPKGAPISHGNVTSYFELVAERYALTPDDVVSQNFDLSFDCAIFDLFIAWGAGATLLAVPPFAFRDLPAFARRERMSVWFSTPSAVAAVRGFGGLGPGAMPGLRWSLFAGEALKADDARQWQAAAPNSTVENIYGPTELTITISAHRWSGDASAARSVNGIVPIGKVHDGHRYLLLGEDGRPSEVTGELCVTGPQMMTRYLDAADEEERFLIRDGLRWFRTGDRVRVLDDGELAYLGRLDSQVQLAGWRVELAEIEHLLRGCAGVDDAVVVAVPAGEALDLVAFHTGPGAEPRELMRRLRRDLPDKMIPRRYRRLDAFPLNANAKTDRSALKRLAEEIVAGAAPVRAAVAAPAPRTAPMTSSGPATPAARTTPTTRMEDGG